MLDELRHVNVDELAGDTVEPAVPTGRRIIRWLAIGLAVLLLVAHAAGGWYFASVIRDDALNVAADDGPDYDITVLAVTADSITFDRESDNPHLTESSTVGLAWDGGYGRIGAIVAVDDETVTRTLVPGWPVPPPGTEVDFDGYAYSGDPASALGTPFQVVPISGPDGSLPAWYVPASDDTWAVFVHGKGASKREALRALAPVHDFGFPALVIGYRNDPGAPSDPSGSYRFGQTEWADLEAAVSYALAEGAESIFLVGYSMGGAIVAAFLENSPLARRVAAVIYDAPLLDLGAAVAAGAADRSLPFTLTATAKWIASIRFDLDWRALDYASRADEWTVPILLFHGADDDTAPFDVSERIAADRPDLVEFHPLDDAGHVQSWNKDPAAYEQAVHDFLARVAAG